MSDPIPMASASPADREALLGREFRHIPVLSVAFAPVQRTEVVLDGVKQTLIGDASAALRTVIGGEEPA